jgi:two-component system, NarL family, nitrate/nitrite response regulator NarL
MPTRVLVIDDHPLFRRGVRQLLDIEGRFEVVGETSTGREGVALALQLQPDLILLDLNMDGMDGNATLQALRAGGCTARIAILTVSDKEQDLVTALRAGADGYLLKDSEPEELLRQFQQILEGRLVLTDELTEYLARSLRQQPERELLGETGLTRREREVLGHLALGLNNKQIARELELSEGTVKVHVKHLLKKLGLRSRLEAALWAVEQQGR